MSVVLRSLLRDPKLTRPLSRALRRFEDDSWLLDDPWPIRRVRQISPGYENPSVLFDEMNRHMAATMNRMQEFAQDLEALDSWATHSHWDADRSGGEGKSKRKQMTNQDDLAVKRTESGSLQLDLDVSDFKPEDLKIKLVDDNLIVEAVNENSGKNSYRRSHFKRWFKLPEDCKLDEIKSKLTEDQRLVIDLPTSRPQLEQEGRSIPIEMAKAKEQLNSSEDNNGPSSNQSNKDSKNTN